MTKKLKTISINFANKEGYPIYIGHDIFDALPSLIQKNNYGKKTFIITNPSLVELYAEPLKAALTSGGYEVQIISFNPGETYKSLGTVSEILDQVLAATIERNDSIIALGGGIVGDVAAFVAAIALRGIHLIQVPTSLLAQVDAAIGGKTGVNHHEGKNLIGSFYQPDFVFIDTKTLGTLDSRELKCGLAEVIKYGVISDKSLFDYIETHSDTLKSLDPKKDLKTWTHLIERSVANKASVVEKDEKESGIREILNFGHTLGHAIESVYDYQRYLHGEAIAIGMIKAADLAYAEGILDKLSYQRLYRLLEALGFETALPEDLDTEKLISHLSVDKKIKKGVLRFILPIKIGETTVYNCPSMDRIRELLENRKESQ